MPDDPKYDLDPDGFHDDSEDIWIRLRVDFQGYSPEQVRWRLAVDNGFTLFFEGDEVATATAGGFTWFWEYSGLFPAPPSGGVELLAAPSEYWVAISASDSGGATALAVELVAVPEPAALGLLGLGFAVVGYATRRRRRLQ